MNFLDLLKIEFMKVRRSKIIPLIFIAPLLVVISGVASLSNYFTPEYTNAWPAMFIQSALVYAYYLLPFSMIVVCVMIAGRETGNNGILKMLALPVSRYTLSIAKFCVLTFYLFMEMVVFLVVFVIAGVVATQTMGITETLPILYLLKWCLGLFLTMLPCIAAMWAITVGVEVHMGEQQLRRVVIRHEPQVVNGSFLRGTDPRREDVIGQMLRQEQGGFDVLHLELLQQGLQL